MKTTHGQRINELTAGQSVVLEKIPAGGSLEARKLSNGSTMFYWRHTRGRKTERLPIGHYDPAAPPKSLQPTTRGYSVAAGLEAARDAARRDRDTPGGLRGERERRTAAQAAKASREKYTLQALCDEYVAWLKAQGKSSCRDVENIFQNHVKVAQPAMARKPAADVSKGEIVAAVRRLIEAGKKTTARKLRAYLRAAFACAVKADSDPNLPQAFVEFGVATNPVESIAAGRVQADKNPLPPAELRKYWAALRDEPGVIGAALRLQLLSGGQRSVQLARVKRSELAGGNLPLLDPKGKRAEPRIHLLPITKRMRAEIDQLPAAGYLLSTDGGETPMHSTSLSTWSQAVAARAGIKDFQLKRVRSGVETLLAAAGVPLHVRGQLQSHGLGGVQERHYDAHQYLPEKRQALELLAQELERRSRAKALRHTTA